MQVVKVLIDANNCLVNPEIPIICSILGVGKGLHYETAHKGNAFS